MTDALFDVEAAPEPPVMKPPKMTERQLLDALHIKLESEARGNGGHRWIIAEHVRSAAGFDARRTADALAIDTWPAKGLELHGFEVKCSRSDWLAELKQPDKSETFRRFCDRWWLVTADRDIVRDDLPDGWGHMTFAQQWMEQHVGMDVWRPEWRERRGLGRAWAGIPTMTLRRVTPAPKLPDRDPISRDILATIMRATAVTANRRAGDT